MALVHTNAIPQVVTWGAIFTIISQGYGTVIQQIVELVPRDVFIDDPTAILGLNHSYTGSSRVWLTDRWNNTIGRYRVHVSQWCRGPAL
jgi:hypothetical protein